MHGLLAGQAGRRAFPRRTFYSGQRKACDVVGQMVDARRVKFDTRKKPAEHGPAVMIENYLTNDAHGAKADGLGIRFAAKQIADDGHKQVRKRANMLFHHGIERGAGFDHLAGHQAAMARLRARGKNAPKEGTCERVQPLFRRGFGRQAHVGRIFFQAETKTLGEHSGVKAVLVAKVIIDGGDIGARALADFPHGGRVKPDFGEDLAGGFEEVLARRVLRGVIGRLKFNAHV